MNIALVKHIIKQLIDKGVSTFCICPGGRSAPFVEFLSKTQGLKILYFFDERSAGFFALGRAQRDKSPVAIVSTSGTAVAELLPAVIEAHYQAISLVLLTADRPLKYGQKGCPQTLKKAINIYKEYCFDSQNISKIKDLDLKKWNSNTNLHLNVCFDEPLIDQKISVFDFSTQVKKRRLKASVLEPSHCNKKMSSKLQVSAFLRRAKKPLILVGELKDPVEVQHCYELLKDYKNPIYLEALSHLQAHLVSLNSGEKILSYALKNGHIDSLIRLGATPRSRFWRDLEKTQFPVLNLSTAPYNPALVRPSVNQMLLNNTGFFKKYLLNLKEFGKDLRQWDELQSKKYQQILKQYPKSEEAWVLTLKKSLKSHSRVFLGNSSPIRLWDQVAFYKKKGLKIYGQNGVNGIDGLASRFLGQCEPKKNNLAILGDLSLLYDMSAFWRSKEYPAWTVVVINNYGGQIFSRLFKNPNFLNSHCLSFKPLAKMWSLNYKLYRDPTKFKQEKAYTLIEICPSQQHTQQAFKKYLSLWN